MKRRKKLYHGCGNPDCSYRKLDNLFETIGYEIPIFRPKELADRFGIEDAKKFWEFVDEIYQQHSLTAVYESHELIGEDPMLLIAKNDNEVEVLALYSLKEQFHGAGEYYGDRATWKTSVH